MKKGLLFLIFIISCTQLNAQSALIDKKLIQNFYLGTNQVTNCYVVTNTMLQAMESGNINTQKTKNNLRIYSDSMDDLLNIAATNSMFSKSQPTISQYRNEWESKMKPAIKRVISFGGDLKKGNIKNYLKSLQPLNEFVSSIYHSTSDEYKTMLDIYNKESLMSLLNASSDSFVDTYTYKGYKLKSASPPTLIVFDKECDYCFETYYNGEIESIKKLISFVKVQSDGSSTTFKSEGNNTLVLEKIVDNQYVNSVVLKTIYKN